MLSYAFVFFLFPLFFSVGFDRSVDLFFFFLLSARRSVRWSVRGFLFFLFVCASVRVASTVKSSPASPALGRW